MSREALLVLADGRAFRGTSLGAEGETVGEVVFNTAMTGYQEVLTDPSYRAQVVCMTYPHQGNYGVNEDDPESGQPHAAGFIVREESPVASSWRSTEELGDYLRNHGIVGLQGIDTRALVRHIRLEGAMLGAISTEILDERELQKRLETATPFGELDLVREVTCEDPFPWNEVMPAEFRAEQLPADTTTEKLGEGLHIVAYDFGIKRNLMRSLRSFGCDVTVVPATTPPAEALAMNPDGVFLSNGPGDPERCDYGVEAVRGLLGKVPLFGVCLGHQLLALAMGGRTFKLKFGHRGANHPVKELSTGRVEITSQNHGYAVDPASLPEGVQVTHTNLNDDTCAGIAIPEKNAFSVQYHPEACPGPRDATPHFLRFIQLIHSAKA